MLVRAGFEYASRIDPFDGGPHFHCRTEKIASVAATRRLKVRSLRAGDEPGGVPAIVAAPRPAAPFFLAVRALVKLAPGGSGAGAGQGPGQRQQDGQPEAQQEGVDLPEETARLLQVGSGDTVGVLPL